MARLNRSFWKGRRVLITGHTGFKGTWLAQILQKLGAEVAGYALAPETNPNHFEILKWELRHTLGDIRDIEGTRDYFTEIGPEVVLHLAAQPLVLDSYENPRETYEINVMGTLNVLEAVRQTPSVKAVIIVTSDKCYENREWDRPYREDDSMGGYDPYSSSKGCAELLTSSYRQSFFNPSAFGDRHQVLLASARAGNVIGGGDWAPNRLLPDFARAFSRGEKVVLRNPEAVRPWQHVIDPLIGYLMLAEKLAAGKKEFAKGWNFGPELSSCWSVGQIVEKVQELWPEFKFELEKSNRHEAKFLMLDSSKAKSELGWNSSFDIQESLSLTLRWYEAYIRHREVLTYDQIAALLSKIAV